MSHSPLLITPGDSLVARIDDIVVFAEGSVDHLQSLSDRLANLLPSTDWIGLVRHLASSISAASFEHPPIACMQLLSHEVKVFVFGDLSIAVETTSSTETVTGIGMTTWREASVTGEVRSLAGGLPEHSDALIGVLERGIVRGGGFMLGAGTAPVARTFIPAAAAAPRSDVDDDDDDERSDPALLISESGQDLDPDGTDFDPEETQIPPTEPVLPSQSFEDPVVETVVVDRDELDRIRASLVSGETAVEREGSVGESDPKDADDSNDAIDQQSTQPPPPPPNAAAFQPAFESDSDIATPVDDDMSPEGDVDHQAEHQARAAGHPSADHPAYGNHTPAHAEPPADAEPEMIAPEAASPQTSEFDSNETTAITGAALSEAVRATRAVAPDPRRSSGTDDDGAEADTAPVLRGLNCPNGHLVSMQDSICRTCSAPVDQSGAIVSGTRPLLGVLEFDDGVRIPLDRPVVIGRQPPEDYRINGEFAYVVPITDSEGLISRVHVEVHLIGWDVELIDKNSVNGTYTSTNAEATSRTRLRSEHPTQIDVGTIVYVGDRIFRLSTGTQA